MPPRRSDLGICISRIEKQPAQARMHSRRQPAIVGRARARGGCAEGLSWQPIGTQATFQRSVKRIGGRRLCGRAACPWRLPSTRPALPSERSHREKKRQIFANSAPLPQPPRARWKSLRAIQIVRAPRIVPNRAGRHSPKRRSGRFAGLGGRITPTRNTKPESGIEMRNGMRNRAVAAKSRGSADAMLTLAQAAGRLASEGRAITPPSLSPRVLPPLRP